MGKDGMLNKMFPRSKRRKARSGLANNGIKRTEKMVRHKPANHVRARLKTWNPAGDDYPFHSWSFHMLLFIS